MNLRQQSALVGYTQLEPNSEVQSVCYEDDTIKSFDDVVLRYARPQSRRGGWIDADFIQLKYHMSASRQVGYQCLINPTFIGGTSESFFGKVKKSLQNCGPNPSYRFMSRHYAGLNPNDALAYLDNNHSGGLRLEWLFDGMTDKSRAGKVRRAWREHLEIDDETLKNMLQVVRLQHETQTLEQPREQINEAARHVGVRSVPSGESTFKFDSLILDHYVQCGGSVIEFDQATLRAFLAEREMLEAQTSSISVPSSSARSPSFDPREQAQRVLDEHDAWLRLYAPLWSVEQQFSLFEHTQKGELINVFEVAQTQAAYVLLGESGGGKTVTLRALAVQAAEALLRGEPGSRLPVLVNLRELQSGSSVFDLVALSLGYPLDKQTAQKGGKVE